MSDARKTGLEQPLRRGRVEEPLVDGPGLAGDAQVVIFEDARRVGGIPAPAGNCFEV